MFILSANSQIRKYPLAKSQAQWWIQVNLCPLGGVKSLQNLGYSGLNFSWILAFLFHCKFPPPDFCHFMTGLLYCSPSLYASCILRLWSRFSFPSKLSVTSLTSQIEFNSVVCRVMPPTEGYSLLLTPPPPFFFLLLSGLWYLLYLECPSSFFWWVQCQSSIRHPLNPH